MSTRDMSKEVYSSSDDEITFDEDSNYSLNPDYDSGLNMRSPTTKLHNLKRPFSHPYESTRDGAHFPQILEYVCMCRISYIGYIIDVDLQPTTAYT